MPVRHIDHVLIAMPAGREEDARAFYHGILGIAELAKPPGLAERGGCWFGSGSLKVHLGVDKNFIPARKAHPAFIVEGLQDLITKIKQAGYKVTEDQPIPGCDRKHIEDPFGNMIELIELQNLTTIATLADVITITCGFSVTPQRPRARICKSQTGLNCCFIPGFL